MKVIQPIILEPFPIEKLRKALEGVEKVICVENNQTHQFRNLVVSYHIPVHASVLKYDGRPFSEEELEKEVAKLL